MQLETETGLMKLEMTKKNLETMYYGFCNRQLKRKYKKQYELYLKVTSLLQLQEEMSKKQEELEKEEVVEVEGESNEQE